ncbi:hypothetical protein HOP57_21455 [Halomonas daqingensis]|nr:hypothetical protein [Halomonas desiderata]
MAVIEYLEGAHPAGFIGIRVATTLGSSSEELSSNLVDGDQAAFLSD